MLEQQTLWLGPWLDSTDSAGAGRVAVERQRIIRDPNTREIVGSARDIQVGSGWWSRLKGHSFEVRESDDDSLLFTMVRCWSLAETWLVREADQRRVGRLCGNLVRDALGRRLALLETTSGGLSGRWRQTDGCELGTFAEADQGILASFSPSTADNPFVKMLLLATLLRQSSRPG